MNKSTKIDQKAKQRYSFSKRPDGTIVIKITVPALDVEKSREVVVSELVKQVELPGFRKGQAPRKLAEEKLNKEAVKEEALKKVLSQEYVAAVRELQINPIVNPRIHVEQFTDGTALDFTAETCGEPEIELKNYKDEVRKIKPASPPASLNRGESLGGPAPKIIVPGSSESEDAEKEAGKKLDEILKAILNVVEIKIPKILIDNETNRLLSSLLDELKKLGITLDQYLSSRGKMAEDLRREYDERAEKDLKLEFVLRKIADEEKITVDQKEIQDAIARVQDEKQKQELTQNPYILAAIIRQQKTLDFLTTL